MAKKRNSENELVVSAGAAPVSPRRKVTVAPHKTHTPPSSVAEPIAEPAATYNPTHEYSPTHEEIAALAYSFWVERGFQSGSEEEDWLRAETELRQVARPATA